MDVRTAHHLQGKANKSTSLIGKKYVLYKLFSELNFVSRYLGVGGESYENILVDHAEVFEHDVATQVNRYTKE